MADILSKSFFRGFRKILIDRFGMETARKIWAEANVTLAQLQKQYRDLDSDSKLMILPTAALLGAMRTYAPEQALPMLIDYGRSMGEKIAGIVHGITSIPGVPEVLWKAMPKLMRSMSGPNKGYTRRIVSENSELVGVDILSCPLHDAAVKIGMPEAALVVCAMDKAYMAGFRHIEYTRTTSVAEGAECCDYRLRYDPNKP